MKDPPKAEDGSAYRLRKKADEPGDNREVNRLCPKRPLPALCTYHITPQGEKGSLVIYVAAYCKNIDFNCCPGFPELARTSQRS